MKTRLQVSEQCRRIKRRAQTIIAAQEEPQFGIARPAARRAWDKAVCVQNEMMTTLYHSL